MLVEGEKPLSGNPNICAKCSSVLDGVDESAVPEFSFPFHLLMDQTGMVMTVPAGSGNSRIRE